MNNAAQFVALDPQKAMNTFNANLQRALRVSSSELDRRVEQDNAEREAKRAQSGQAKRGPKPKSL